MRKEYEILELGPRQSFFPSLIVGSAHNLFFHATVLWWRNKHESCENPVPQSRSAALERSFISYQVRFPDNDVSAVVNLSQQIGIHFIVLYICTTLVALPP